MKFNIILVIIFSFSLVTKAQKTGEQDILNTFPNKEVVTYKTVDGKTLKMTIFYPENDNLQKKNPWMLHVHGGGWAGGSQYNILKKAFLGTLRGLLDNGVVCATIEYRLARGKTTAYEAVVDAKDAARFLIKHAKQYKLSKKHYGVWGGSAGGHLSLLTALGHNSDFLGDTELQAIVPKFKCIASYFPFTSCVNPEIRPGSIFEDGKLFVRLLGAPIEEKPELAKLLSPTEYLNKKTPPILLLHGDQDDVLPIKNSTYMLEVAKQKQANVELLTIKGAAHSFHGKNISPSIEELNNYATEFILSHL